MAEAGEGTYRKDVDHLMDILEDSPVRIESDAADTLTALGKITREWNRRVNLISRKDIERLVSYHYCDAVSLLPIIRPEVDIQVLDVGGSNGLPGLVLAATSPHVAVTVCDSKRKREGFLREACAALQTKASYTIDRVDTEAFRQVNLAKFDLIVARAVTRLKILVKWCLPLLRQGGYIAAYKGSRCADEVKAAEGYLWSHGANVVMVLGSPFAPKCNPFRQFAIIGKSR